jgi:CheY-like chemotaxis protein
MDIKMPVMDGYEAARKIRLKFPGLPVIAQTAHAMTSDIERIEQEGFNGVIVKPINPEKVRELIRKQLCM